MSERYLFPMMLMLVMAVWSLPLIFEAIRRRQLVRRRAEKWRTDGLSSDYNASLPDWPQAASKEPVSLSSRNTIKFLAILGIALLFVLAYAASR